jgi:hypothetical protein
MHALTRLLARADRLHERASRVSAQFTRWRLAIFVAGVLASVVPFKLGWYHLGNGALLVFLLIFLTVARYHNRLENRMHRLRIWRSLKRAHLSRLRLDWDGVPNRPMPPTDQHPYAGDLDIVGRYSLLRLLDTTVSSNGRERLTGWLLDQPPDGLQWRRRQALVKELAALPLLRDRLVLEATLVGEAEVDGRRIQAALSATPVFPRLMPLLLVEAGLAVMTVMLGLWALLGDGPSYWSLSFGAYALLYMAFSGDLAPVFGRALSLHDELDKLGALFGVLESRSYRATPQLEALCGPLLTAGHRPSETIRPLARVISGLSVKAHPLFHLGINALVPWDFYWTFRLGQLRRTVEAELPQWLETLAELEAASGLAAFAYLHPQYCWPVPLTTDGNGQAAAIVGRSVGHPLIAASHRITNDADLRGLGRILIVTGSNMSGKSTFLRTLGVNICLAQAGAPVCAASFAWTWVRPSCCIRVDDSLEAGLSFFYAEVKRLKRLLDAAHVRSAPPVLFLIDEIFKGTNNRERLIGSRAFIRALAGSNGFGLVTTHDLELAELEQEIPLATNAHFQETVEHGALRFDYRLRPGPCPTTNALRIMALEGLPVPEQNP